MSEEELKRLYQRNDIPNSKIGKVYKSLADFQQEVPPIYKGTSGYGYKYADWGEILQVVNPLLKKHNLGFTQLLDGTSLKTIVFHTEEDSQLVSTVDIPQGVELKGMNDFQVLGSAITYLRRYSLSSILGLVTDEDADASGEQTGKKEVKPTYTPSATKTASDKQIYFINNLLSQHGIEENDRAEYLASEFGVLKPREMSQKDAQMIIEALSNEKEN